MSGHSRLPSPHGPGSSHVIGVCAPFTVWAVVPLLAGNNNNRKKNPYKNNRDPTCSKRYPEPVDTKDLTVVGVARSQCSVFADSVHTDALESAASFGLGHAHLRLEFFFAKSQKP